MVKEYLRTSLISRSKSETGVAGCPSAKYERRLDSDEDEDADSNDKIILRGRNLDRATEHSLHEAVSSIKVNRSLSPDLFATGKRAAHHSDPRAHDHLQFDLNKSDIHRSRSEVQSEDEIEQDSTNFRPHRMVRKKSGELVRSSLKVQGSKGRRPASMPSTPVFTKNVHFDRKLEHIRHFLHSEKPAAVSANTSPSQEYLHQSEYPFHIKNNDDYELSINLPNFVPEAQQTENSDAIIKVETVYLSTDRRSLIGRVAVRNISYHKHVSVRYTMDYWRTTSETAAEYTQDIRRKQRDDGLDRFLFTIKIDDFTGVTDKTMFFCVRYNCDSKEFWDSNGGMNFRVEFHKEQATERRFSDPPTYKQVATVPDLKLDTFELSNEALTSKILQSPRSLIYENIYDDKPGINAGENELENPVVVKVAKKKPVATGDAFSNRYDFGASLSAAIAAANTTLQQGLGQGHPDVEAGHNEQIANYQNSSPYFATHVVAGRPLPITSGTMSPNFPPALDSSENNTPLSSGNVSPVPGLSTKASHNASLAYQELLNNYCFFGTQKPGVQVKPKAIPNLAIAASEKEPHGAAQVVAAETSNDQTRISTITSKLSTSRQSSEPISIIEPLSASPSLFDSRTSSGRNTPIQI